jgi:hypothetical protein
MSSKEHWYAVHLEQAKNTPHAGFYHVRVDRDEAGHRVLNYQIAFRGEIEDTELDHEASCRIVLERHHGRFTPLEIEYHEPSHAAHMQFVNGHIRATGAAAGHDGASVPDDVIPTYAISVLAEGIYNQPEASVLFSGITEGTGIICASEAKLVAKGKTGNTPFKSRHELWRVDWLSHEGLLTQSFYFSDEGVLEQADWGASRARLVETPEEAIPQDFPAPVSLQDPREA